MKKKIWVFQKSYNGARKPYTDTIMKKGELLPDMVMVFNTKAAAMEYARGYECEWNGSGWSSSYYQYIREMEITIADGVPSKEYGTYL